MIPLLILAGGRGTRLQSVNPDRPKPMVEVGGKPFLHWLIAQYVRQGHSRFLISTGYLPEVIETYPWAQAFPQARFSFHRESTPLGTGGATRAIFEADPTLSSAWVINGDTLLTAPLPPPPEAADAVYAVMEHSEVFQATPRLWTEGDFVLAEDAGGHYFDAGAVFLNRAAVQRGTQAPPCSIHDILRPSMALKRVHWKRVHGTCWDIGTPERLKKFETFLGASHVE